MRRPCICSRHDPFLTKQASAVRHCMSWHIVSGGIDGMVFKTQRKNSLAEISARFEVFFGASSSAVATSPTSSEKQSNKTNTDNNRSGRSSDAASRSGGRMPECPAVVWGPDDATPGRWRHSTLSYVGFAARIVIVTAFAVLAMPKVVFAQSTDGPMAVGAIPAQSLRADGWTVTLNVREYFEASDALVIKASSLDETVATATATGRNGDDRACEEGRHRHRGDGAKFRGIGHPAHFGDSRRGPAPDGLQDRDCCRPPSIESPIPKMWRWMVTAISTS